MRVIKSRLNISVPKKVKILFIGALLGLSSCIFHKQTETPSIAFVSVRSTKELASVLKKYGLWNLQKIPPTVVIKSLPPDFKYIKDKRLKRKLFIRTLMPSALTALMEVNKEREVALKILKKIGYPKVIDERVLKKGNLSETEMNVIKSLMRKYKAFSSYELLKRINIIPISLLLAQAAIESNWGSSRFALQGNNLYGIWTYKNEGLVPLNRDPGEKHKVAKYSSILEATRNYIYNLNVGWAYEAFRDARLVSDDPIFLSQFLEKYSQLGPLYSKKIREIIVKHHLRRYDYYAQKLQPCFGHINLCALNNWACPNNLCQ